MSPIPLGILAVAGSAPAGAYELIQTQVLSSSASSVTFSSIPQTYKHLQVRLISQNDNSASTNAFLRINSDSGSNYAWHYLSANGSSVSSSAAASQSSVLFNSQSNGTANAFGSSVIDVLDYSAITKNKTVRIATSRSAPFNNIGLWSGLWADTSAVTALSFANTNSTSFVAGSRFSLYGIKG